MKKTKIDWADSTWNPITGCLHNCEYCYAKNIAYRFGTVGLESNTENGYECDLYEGTGENHVINSPVLREWKNGRTTKAPYPFCFDPTFHRYKLDEPKRWTKPRNIFVCSMADLFGEWVPDQWILEVFDACDAAPQHRYLFLTKNPERYLKLAEAGKLPNTGNMWFGSTTTTPDTDFFFSDKHHTFWSIEPILKPFRNGLLTGVEACEKTNWIIVGAETGNRKNKVIPEASWIMDIVECADVTGTPIFMKESLRGIMGDCFRQEFPWEVSGDD